MRPRSSAGRRTLSTGPQIPLARDAPVPGDPFAEWNSADAGRFPTYVPGQQDDSDEEDDAPLGARFGWGGTERGTPVPTEGLTTRQLQILARGGRLDDPEDFTENVGVQNLWDPEPSGDENELEGRPRVFKRHRKRRAPNQTHDGTDVDDPDDGGAAPVKDPRRTKEQRKSMFRLGRGRSTPHELGDSARPDAKEEYDYDEITGQWHRRQDAGWLQRRGIDARLPTQLIMPEPLVNDTHLVSLLPPGMRQVQLQRQMIMQERAQIAEMPTGDARHNAKGLHVPPGFVLHDGKGLPPVRFLTVEAAAARTNRRDLRTRDPEQRAKDRELARAKALAKRKDADEAVDAFLRSDNAAELVLPVPADAPPALGERAATATTALFRNPLVHDPADQDGWGWDAQALAETTILDATDEAERHKTRFKVSARQKRKMAKAKKLRRKERRRRRRAHEEIEASGGAWEGGVISDDSSPDELADASEGDSSDSSDLSEESEPDRWVDEGPAAGTLYGKSLLDLAQQRATTRKKQTRYVHLSLLVAGRVGRLTILCVW